MLTLNELIAIAEKDGADVKTVERDYVLTHLVQRLSHLENAELLTFKGGTALRLVHFLQYRYSADIDLNINDPSRLSEEEAIELLAEAADQTRADVGIAIDVEEGRLSYTGPRNQAKPEKVKLDIASDEISTSEPIRRPLVLRYDDQAEMLSLPTYGLDESAAEKLRCVVQRLQCRDLFDIHRLLVGEGVDVDTAWRQFQAKAAHRGIDPGVFSERWPGRMKQYRERWDTEMLRYTSDIPHFENTKREVERALRPLGVI